MKIKATNIDWDTDGLKIDLPRQVNLEIGDEFQNETDSVLEDEIAEELSAVYDWCVYGFDYEIV